MGQTLSEPVTNKITSSQQNEQMFVGSSSMQGWRINMEDAHTHILKLGPESAECSFFAVYDGHGGAAVAEYAGKQLHKRFIERPEYAQGDIETALRVSLLGLDEEMMSLPEMRDELAGSTAIVVVWKGDTLYIANLGDSRAVACWNGRCDALSQDHKPSNELESKRITAAGGWVECNRVNGNLALSRALGDFVFKKNEKKSAEEQIVTALPDIETRKFSEELEFVLLACDGIWDVMTNEEVVEFVRARIAEKMEPPIICEELMTRCLAPDCLMGGLGCDNMTVVVVCFLHGKSYEHLAARCAIPAPPRGRLHSTGSSDSSSPATSCSNTTPETSDEDETNGGQAVTAGAEAEETLSKANGDVSEEPNTQLNDHQTKDSTQQLPSSTQEEGEEENNKETLIKP